MKRFLTTGLPALAIGISLVNACIIGLALPAQTDRDHFSDWVGLVLPLVVVFVCFALSIGVLRVDYVQSTTIRAALWGAFAGGFVFLVLQAIALVLQHRASLEDGMAYWAIVFLSAFWLGLPLLLVGAAIGYFQSIWAQASRKDSRV